MERLTFNPGSSCSTGALVAVGRHTNVIAFDQVARNRGIGGIGRIADDNAGAIVVDVVAGGIGGAADGVVVRTDR